MFIIYNICLGDVLSFVGGGGGYKLTEVMAHPEKMISTQSPPDKMLLCITFSLPTCHSFKKLHNKLR